MIGMKGRSRSQCIHHLSAKTSRSSAVREIGCSLGPKMPLRVSNTPQSPMGYGCRASLPRPRPEWGYWRYWYSHEAWSVGWDPSACYTRSKMWIESRRWWHQSLARVELSEDLGPLVPTLSARPTRPGRMQIASRPHPLCSYPKSSYTWYLASPNIDFSRDNKFGPSSLGMKGSAGPSRTNPPISASKPCIMVQSLLPIAPMAPIDRLAAAHCPPAMHARSSGTTIATPRYFSFRPMILHHDSWGSGTFIWSITHRQIKTAEKELVRMSIVPRVLGWLTQPRCSWERVAFGIPNLEYTAAGFSVPLLWLCL